MELQRVNAANSEGTIQTRKYTNFNKDQEVQVIVLTETPGSLTK